MGEGHDQTRPTLPEIPVIACLNMREPALQFANNGRALPHHEKLQIKELGYYDLDPIRFLSASTNFRTEFLE
jgi:hypothetical protein